MILPPHPYRVSPVFVRRHRINVLVTVILVVLFLSGAVYELVEARRLAAERRIWATGVETTQVGWKGTRLASRQGGITYDLDVRFLDANRVERGGRVAFSTLYGSIDTTTPAVVHYLPEHPDSFAFSKAMDLMPERINSAAILLVMAAGLGMVFGWLGLRLWRVLGAARACAAGAEEVEMSVVLKERAGPGVRFKLRGESPWGTPLQAVLGSDKHLGGPLFLDRGQTRVLALVCRAHPSVPVVIREGLLPYEFSPSEEASVRMRLGSPPIVSPAARRPGW